MGSVYSAAVKIYSISAATHDAADETATVSVAETTIDVEIHRPTNRLPSTFKDAFDLHELVDEYFNDIDQAMEIYAMLGRCFRKTMFVVFITYIKFVFCVTFWN